jgi:hypothetical protein
MELKWENPPVKTSGRKPNADYDALAEVLRANPKEWLLIGENMPVSTGTHINTGRLASFRPAGHFEATIRGNVNGIAQKVWARYVGDTK